MRSHLVCSFVLLTALFPAVAQVQNPVKVFKSTHDKITAADPFDTGTGIYFREYRDLYVKDTIPIDFTRTQRNMDPRVRSFGIGASTSYDMFIVGDVYKFSWVALVLADGSQERAVTDLRLRCGASEITLPLKLDGTLQNSEVYIPLFSHVCAEVGSKRKAVPKNVSKVIPDKAPTP